MRTENESLEDRGPEAPLTDEERARECEVNAEWMAERIQNRVRLLIRLKDFDGADAFLDRIWAVIR
jgi:hypothetical protein